jgi:glutaredoxin
MSFDREYVVETEKDKSIDEEDGYEYEDVEDGDGEEVEDEDDENEENYNVEYVEVRA